MDEEADVMRVVLVSAPNHGHTVPLLLVGDCLARAGHRVTMVCSEQNSAWVLARPEVVQAGGLIEVIVLRDSLPEQDRGDKQAAMRQLGRLGRKFAERLRELHAEEPVGLLLFDVWVRAAPVVAAELQIPCVLQWYGDLGTLEGMLDFHSSPMLDVAIGQRRRASHRVVLPNLRRAGLPVLVPSSLLIQAHLSPPPHGRMVGLLQRRVRRPDLSSQPELLRFLDSAELPVIFVTLGSELRTDLDMETNGHEAALVGRLFEGLDSPRWAVVWACAETLQHHLPADLADNPRFFLAAWVPQSDVVAHPRVRAVLTHCGWGCCRECLVHGKPVVGLPFFGDQLPNAQRLAELGLGPALETAQVSSQDVRSAVEDVLIASAERYTRTAQLLSERLEEERIDVAAEVAALLPQARAAVRECQQPAEGQNRRSDFSKDELQQLGGLMGRLFANMRKEAEQRDAKPWPANRMPPFQLFIAGTWNDYKPCGMTWKEGFFEYVAKVGASGWESFQILVDGSWDMTIYPSMADANAQEGQCAILGPDSEGHGKNWQIGKGGAEEARPGMRFVISASLNERGGVSTVAWQPC